MSKSCLATSAIIPQAVAAPAMSVFIVSMPAGDFKESPPESNRTPLPIKEICFFAFGLYSPTRNFGDLSEPWETPITPPILFSLIHPSSYDLKLIFNPSINPSTLFWKNSGDLVSAGKLTISRTQNIELTLFSISVENSLFKIFIFISGDLVDLKLSNRYVDNIIPSSIKYMFKFSAIAVNFKSQSLLIFLPIDTPRSTKS